MIAGRDSRGRFIKGNVIGKKRVASSQSEMTRLTVRKVIDGGRIKLKLVPVGPKKLIGGGVLKLERVRVICPACGEQLEAVARDGQVLGYCAVAKQHVDFPIETRRLAEHLTVEHKAEISAAHSGKHPTAEYRAKLSAASKKLWQNPEYRAKQIAVRTSKYATAEHRAKISAAKKGKHLTAETKAKISAALKRRHEAKRRANEDR